MLPYSFSNLLTAVFSFELEMRKIIDVNPVNFILAIFLHHFPQSVIFSVNLSYWRTFLFCTFYLIWHHFSIVFTGESEFFPGLVRTMLFSLTFLKWSPTFLPSVISSTRIFCCQSLLPPLPWLIFWLPGSCVMAERALTDWMTLAPLPPGTWL